jgi:hypothetical protein|tara:strand:- start:39 stop:407 length:369 start_codon:yes stop_codon:yes gene_type:complete
MDGWDIIEAAEMCREIEAFCPEYGAHVALTGGTLYKDGRRKDCDILFYCIRQRDNIDEIGLLGRMRKEGFEIGVRKGWVRKAKFRGKNVDIFFPEAYPASSGQSDDYEEVSRGSHGFGCILP